MDDLGTPPADEQLAQYRAALATLMERALRSIREFELPESPEPKTND